MNPARLEKSFKLYLSETRHLSPQTIKNYLSDWRHFWQWLTLTLISQGKINTQELNQTNLIIEAITPSLLNRYKIYLSANNIAKATVKRRLATIRAFCQFCFNQRWLKQNPALRLENPPNLAPKERRNKEIETIVSQFGLWLKQQGASKNTIKNYVADVRAYLLFQQSAHGYK